jgi:RNA-splicing ligase RtcB|tara:strand:+ start:42 stop:1112 length:1071 start_codon:yes stop_codon:yes gene_type:complete
MKKGKNKREKGKPKETIGKWKREYGIDRMKVEGKSYLEGDKPIKKACIINLSENPTILNFNTKGLEKIVFLPDYSLGNGALPTGTVSVYNSNEHIVNGNYIGPDIGCGMKLCKFKNPLKDNLENLSNEITSKLFENRKGMGSLGNGNHFVTLYEVSDSSDKNYEEKTNFVLIHTGSREYGREIFERNLKGSEYLINQSKALNYAKENRNNIGEMIEKLNSEKLEEVLEAPHNYVESQNEKIIYRKGAIKLNSQEIGIIPSSMGGDALIIKAKPEIIELCNSFSHATGRKISRKEGKKEMFFLDGFPEEIYMPYFISPENLNEELPPNYRTIEEILPQVENYCEIIARLKPKSSIML